MKSKILIPLHLFVMLVVVVLIFRFFDDYENVCNKNFDEIMSVLISGFFVISASITLLLLKITNYVIEGDGDTFSKGFLIFYSTVFFMQTIALIYFLEKTSMIEIFEFL